MPIEKKTKRKSEQPNPYPIHFSEEERKRYDTFAKEHGYATLSKLIRNALEVVIRNPALLEPTESLEPMKAIEKFDSISKQYFQGLDTSLKTLDDRMKTMERLQESMALEVGMSKKDIKKAQKKDVSGEVVFE